MQKILLVLITLGTFSFSQAQDTNQSVLATAGKTQESKTISLSWTLGELAIQNYSNTEGMYTEGFHQPIIIEENLNQSIDLENEQQDRFLKIVAGPNPVHSILNVQINSDLEGRGRIDLHDFQGRIQQSIFVNLEQDQIDLNMQALAAGMYSITLYTLEGELLKSFKINKIEL